MPRSSTRDQITKFIGLLVMALVGCEHREEPVIDQCMRREIFFACLSALPKGPERTKYNDWEDVVDSCEHAAVRQSYRLESQVKPECRL